MPGSGIRLQRLISQHQRRVVQLLLRIVVGQSREEVRIGGETVEALSQCLDIAFLVVIQPVGLGHVLQRIGSLGFVTQGELTVLKT